MHRKYILTTLLILFAALLTTKTAIAAKPAPVKVEALSWLNQNFLSKQRQRIDKLTRRHFGKQIQGKLSDLIVLQRLIDHQHVDRKSDIELLQAMGVAIGDVYVDQQKALHWQVYEDQLGRSHAVCVEYTTHCIFPITMLSRRIEVGIKPNVQQIFDKGNTFIQPYLPKRPFDGR